MGENNNKTTSIQPVTICDRFESLKHSSVCPYVFTEQGVAMLSSVFRSNTAVSVSIQIMDAFVAMRRFLVNNAQIFQRLETIEHHQLEMQQNQKETDKRIDTTIYIQQINRQLQLGINRHNAQYPPITAKVFHQSHDRFMIIDNDVYHIGASIKDLGKKWFGFTLMKDITATEIINRINEVY